MGCARVSHANPDETALTSESVTVYGRKFCHNWLASFQTQSQNTPQSPQTESWGQRLARKEVTAQSWKACPENWRVTYLAAKIKHKPDL